jgi:hypothetical protein
MAQAIFSHRVGRQAGPGGGFMKSKTLNVRDDEKAPNPLRDEQQVQNSLNAVVGEQVMHALGRPPDLYAVQVKRLWLDNLRVNILLGADATSVRVGHSYFLTVSGDGNILSSNPKITKLY